MIYSLLEGEGTTNAASGYGNWIMLAILAVLIVVVVVMYVLGNKKRKKQEQDAKDLINAVKPGNKVKTIGGICGIVVEVDDEENTFVLETGTELSGKSYIKFDRQAIYQTDAVVEKPEANTAAEEPAEEAIEAPAEATEVAEVVEETPVAEEAPAEETKGKKSKKND
jgi:preprotein translocase subunit YajC